jgi:hypothetical protein
MKLTHLLFVLPVAMVGCGDAGSGSDCGHESATKDLSVVYRNEDDSSTRAKTVCEGRTFEVFAGSSAKPTSIPGIFERPVGAPLATASSAGDRPAEFALSPGNYLVCTAGGSCGTVELSGRRVYGTMTCSIGCTWRAREDAADSLR